MARDDLIQRLLRSDEPSIRFKVRVGVLDEDPLSPSIKRLQSQIRDGALVRALLSTATGVSTRATMSTTNGTARIWVFASLADLGYPPGTSR